LVTVKNGASLIGTGRISGEVIIESGAVLGAGSGDSASGTLTLAGNVTLSDSSTIQIALGSTSTTHTVLAGTGGSWVFDTDQQFSFLDFGAVGGTYAGIITGLTSPVDTSLWKISSLTNPGLSGSFSYNASTSSVDFTLAAVPEPSTVAFLLFGAVGLRLLVRRQRA